MTIGKSYHSFLIVFILFSCTPKKKTKIHLPKIYDRHVHIMSPELIEDWKELGIPFSKPSYYYSNIDSIFKANNSDLIHLIGMGYVYENPDFYQGTNAPHKLRQENDYLLKVASKYKEKIVPFFAVNPLKDYALDEIERCSNLNEKAGLKLHFSSSQVYLTEPEHLKKVRLVFEMAAIKKIPVLLHFDNWHPKFGKNDVEILVDSILNKIEAIDLTIAHFGTSGGFHQKTKDVMNAFIDVFKESKISTKHNILFDISAVALAKDSEGVQKLTAEEFKALKELCNSIGYDKIVFGTDYPLYTTDEYIEILRAKLNLSDSLIQKLVSF